MRTPNGLVQTANCMLAWTTEEKEFLRLNFHKLPLQESAQRLGRSERAVYCMASCLKLKRPKRNKQ